MNKKILTASIMISSLFIIAGCSSDMLGAKSKSEMRAEMKEEVRAELEKEQSNSSVDTSNTAESSDKEVDNSTEVSTNAEVKGNIVTSVDEKSVENYLKPLTVEAIKAYASAIETGNKDEFYSLVDKNVVVNEDLYYDPQFSKDQFSQTIDATKEKYGDDVIQPLIAGLSKVNVDELELGYSNVTETSATFQYSYKPEGFYTSVGVSFRYEKKGDNGEFMLSQIDF